MEFKSNKELVQFFLDNLWADPQAAKAVCTKDVTWITSRSMPIPGAGDTIEHVGWDAVYNVATSGLKIDTGYIPETMEYPNWLVLEAEDDHVVVQFTMKCKTKTGKDYLNDYLFFFKCNNGKVARFQEYWDSKQAYDILLNRNSWL
jgi:ketosteroid isomerase-like protein